MKVQMFLHLGNKSVFGQFAVFCFFAECWSHSVSVHFILAIIFHFLFIFQIGKMKQNFSAN